MRVLEDSDFSVQLPDLLADAKDRLEEAAFATGTGTGQPKGCCACCYDRGVSCCGDLRSR